VAALLLLCASDAAAIEMCGSGKRITCVVDGDTFWLAGEKVRIAAIDAPEMDGRCQGERVLARRATARLVELLSVQPIKLHRDGVDRFGRTIATVLAGGCDVGGALVAGGYAREWRGRRESWCGGG
jgi:micrococcal nuclease